MTFCRKAFVLILLKNLFHLFCLSVQNILVVSRIQTQIVGVGGEDTDHSTTITAQVEVVFGHLTWMDSFTEGFVILFDVIWSHSTKRQRQQSGASPKTCLSRYWQPTSFLELISYEADFYEGPLSHSCWLTFAAAAADLTQIFQIFSHHQLNVTCEVSFVGSKETLFGGHKWQQQRNYAGNFPSVGYKVIGKNC